MVSLKSVLFILILTSIDAKLVTSERAICVKLYRNGRLFELLRINCVILLGIPYADCKNKGLCTAVGDNWDGKWGFLSGE